MLPVAVHWLIEAAKWAPSADNTQPWHFSWDGKYFRIQYDYRRVKDKSFPIHHPATLLSGGAVLENLEQMMTSLGLPENSLTIGAFPNDELAKIQVDLSLKPKSDQSNHPLFGRHTNRLPFKKTDISQKIQSISSKAFLEDARMKIIDSRVHLDEIANLVSLASSIRFQIREVHEWLSESLRFSSAEVIKGDGLDAATLGLPPGGKALLKFIGDWNRMERLNRFGAYKLLASMEAMPIRQAPALIAIIGNYSEKGAINAGRLMERLWIELNHFGLAVQPFFVIPDQIFRYFNNNMPEKLVGLAKKIDSDVKQKFDLKQEECLYMILRVGNPKKSPVQSRRLVTSLIFSDTANKVPEN